MTENEEVKKIAALAMLKLNDDEVEKIRNNFSRIRDYFDSIAPIDTKDETGVDSDDYFYRTDAPVQSSVNIQNISDYIENNSFTVPKVIE